MTDSTDDLDYYDARLESSMDSAIRRLKREGVWITREGERILISEMKTDHINRTIKLLEKQSNLVACMYIKAFHKELGEREKY